MKAIVCPQCGFKEANFEFPTLECKYCYMKEDFLSLLKSVNSKFDVEVSASDIYSISGDTGLICSFRYDNTGRRFIVSCPQPSVVKETINFLGVYLGYKVSLIQTSIDANFKGCPLCGKELFYSAAGSKGFVCIGNEDHFKITDEISFFGSLLCQKFPHNAYSHKKEGYLLFSIGSRDFKIEFRKGETDIVIAFPQQLVKFRNGSLLNILNKNLYQGIRLVIVNIGPE